MIYAILIFTLLNVILAYTDAHKIINNQAINHTINAVVYLGALGISVIILKDYWLVPTILLIRLLIFNIALSLFRGKKWDYVPLTPLSTIDRMANMIFKNGRQMYFTYTIILFICLLIELLFSIG